jgi:hypothetical protein
VSDLLLKGGNTLLQEGQLRTPICLGSGCSFLGWGGWSKRRRDDGRSTPFTRFTGKWIREEAVMQGCELMELRWGQTFEASIDGMDAARQMGRGQPESQGLGIDA